MWLLNMHLWRCRHPSHKAGWSGWQLPPLFPVLCCLQWTVNDQASPLFDVVLPPLLVFFTSCLLLHCLEGWFSSVMPVHIYVFIFIKVARRSGPWKRRCSKWNGMTISTRLPDNTWEISPLEFGFSSFLTRRPTGSPTDEARDEGPCVKTTFILEKR